MEIWPQMPVGVLNRSLGRALEWHSRGQRFDPAYLHQNNNSHSQCCVSYCFIQEEYEDEHSVKRCVPKPVQKMHGLFFIFNEVTRLEVYSGE